jgi:hypothetical protein
MTARNLWKWVHGKQRLADARLGINCGLDALREMRHDDTCGVSSTPDGWEWYKRKRAQQWKHMSWLNRLAEGKKPFRPKALNNAD